MYTNYSSENHENNQMNYSNSDNKNSNKKDRSDRPNFFFSVVWKVSLVAIVFVTLFLGLIQFGVISLSSKILPEAVLLGQTEVGIKKGRSYQLVTTVVPVNAENKQIVYESSNPNVAVVNDVTGYVTAVANGTAVITAKTLINEKIGECVVNVGNVGISATGVNFKRKYVKVAAGYSELLSYTVTPKNATEQTMTFTSSDPSIATVDSKGWVRGLKEGNATITISANNGTIKDEAYITVYRVGTSTVVEGEVVTTSKLPNVVTVDEQKNLAVGAEVQLEAKTSPVDAVNEITWLSTNENVAKVNEYGKVTATGVGEATIVAKTVNDKTAATYVTVGNYTGDYAIKLNEIYITTNYTFLRLGQNKRLYVSYLPVKATNPKISWSSENSNIATVDNDGLVKAVGAGSTKIEARAINENLTDTCIVEVGGDNNVIPVSSISFDSSIIDVGIGNTISITPKIAPSNATYKQVTYVSSNPDIARVDENGQVTGIAAGEVTITVNANHDNISATIKVNVKNNPSVSVELNSTNETINLNDIFTLVATVKPATASNKTVTYTSSNPEIAVVDQTGKVTAKSTGTATITVTPNGGGAASYCTVTVN